jgi:hypothetical protein
MCVQAIHYLTLLLKSFQNQHINERALAGLKYEGFPDEFPNLTTEADIILQLKLA